MLEDATIIEFKMAAMKNKESPQKLLEAFVTGYIGKEYNQPIPQQKEFKRQIKSPDEVHAAKDFSKQAQASGKMGR